MGDLGLALQQGRYNLQKFFRNPRTLVFGVAMPVVLLVLFNSAFAKNGATTHLAGREVPLAEYYTAGMAAYAVMLTAFSGLLIEIVSAREAGRLKRFRGTPMPPWVFIAGQILYTLLVSAVMVAVLSAVGILGYDVDVRAEVIPALVVYVFLGVFTFTCLALALARVVSSSDMASSVGPFSVVGLGFISGVFIPTETLPSWLQEVGRIFPLAPMATGMQEVFTRTTGSAFHAESIAVLAVWGIGSLAIAARTFSWQPVAAGH